MMSRKIGVFLFVVAAILATMSSLRSQPVVTPGPFVSPCSALLTPDRNACANWRMAGLQSIGGIPNRVTQCGSTLSPLGSGMDDTSSINTAIGNCTAGQVLQLSAGTFTIAEGNYILLNKGVSLRGMGAANTILHRPTSGVCPPTAGYGATINCSSGGTSPSNVILIAPVARFVGDAITACALTSDIAGGSYQATVTSGCATNFHVGDVVLLDELSGAVNNLMPDAQNPSNSIWASSDYRVVYHIHTPTCCGDDGTNVESDYTLNTDRVTNELKRVAAVSGNVVTFDSPSTISYRVSHTADLWSFATPFLQQAGLEDVAVEYGDDGAIQMQFCAYCWLYNVEARYSIGPTVQMNTTFRAQIDRSYIHDAAWPVPGGAGYLIDMRYDTAETYLVNSISVLGNKAMTSRGSGAGSVIAYNYVDKAYISGDCCWQEIGLNASHLVGPHHVLMEGNWAFNIDSDATHGGSIYMTHFRNWATAIRGSFVGLSGQTWNDAANTCGTTSYSGSPLRAIGPQAYSYWFSFIGNVFGTAGCTTQANGFPLTNSYGGSQNSDGMFLTGWWNQGASINDPMSATIYPNVPANVNGVAGANCTTSGTNCATIMNGNYNYWNDAISWASNDTNHALPSSLYLNGKPAFFSGASCTYAWPWVDPVGGTPIHNNSCGGSGNPAKARYDAGTPFAQP